MKQELSKNRKVLSVNEHKNFVDTLEEGKIYHVNELVEKAIEIYPDRSAESLRHTLGSVLVEKGFCLRVGYGRYMKKYPLNHPKNPQPAPMLFQSSPPATILHLATDKELADELRRRGYEVEAKKITTI